MIYIRFLNVSNICWQDTDYNSDQISKNEPNAYQFISSKKNVSRPEMTLSRSPNFEKSAEIEFLIRPIGFGFEATIYV